MSDSSVVTTLFVGNLDRRVTEASIARVFKPHGDIRRIQFMWHQSGPRRGEPRGFSFVEFATRAQALAARQQTSAEGFMISQALAALVTWLSFLLASKISAFDAGNANPEQDTEHDNPQAPPP